MVITEISTGKKHKVEIVPVENSDFKTLGKDRYFFDWKTEKEYEVFKLQIIGSTEALGLVSMERIPSEWRVHIRLLTVSVENKGKGKKYDGIAGNLMAFTAKIAVRDYAEFACLSLRPKTEIAQHYIEKYNMTPTGLTLSIMVPEILELINSYDHD
ncbi:MAG: N-acetyltransferase [Balneolaceae bacterium]|nr:MAG: N-acetyltransferase [Balneolaceae bacterium]